MALMSMKYGFRLLFDLKSIFQTHLSRRLCQKPPFTAGQKNVVAHHFKMLRRHVADITTDHLFLSQRLLAMLLCWVVVIVMHHGTAAVVPELLRRDRRSLQVPG